MTLNSNFGTTKANARGMIGYADSDEEFRAFDALPAELRRKLANAPVKILAKHCLQSMLLYGPDHVARAIDQLVQQVTAGADNDFDPEFARKVAAGIAGAAKRMRATRPRRRIQRA